MTSERQGRIEKATRQQLRAASVSVQNNGLAALAVMLARALDEGIGARDAAAVARELRGTLSEATKGATPAQPTRSVLDELRAQREARRGKAG